MWCVFPAYYFIWGVSHLVSCGLFCFVFWIEMCIMCWDWIFFQFLLLNSYFDTNDDDTYTHVLLFILFFMNELKNTDFWLFVRLFISLTETFQHCKIFIQIATNFIIKIIFLFFVEFFFKFTVSFFKKSFSYFLRNIFLKNFKFWFAWIPLFHNSFFLNHDISF